MSIRVEFVGKSPFSGASRRPCSSGGRRPTPAQWQAAVDAARAADVAVVFVNDIRTEGADLPTLELPGDQDELIDAVARPTRSTVVVLNTGGPVLTPWRDEVAAILEAWYPGQENGDAIASLLFGDVNPSGKLPATFPSSDAQGRSRRRSGSPASTAPCRYSEGLLVGYRWYDAHGAAARCSRSGTGSRTRRSATARCAFRPAAAAARP